MNSTRMLMTTLVGLSSIALGCSRGTPADPSSDRFGTATVSIAPSEDMQIGAVMITVDGPGIKPAITVELELTDGKWKTAEPIEILAGVERTFVAEAYNATPPPDGDGKVVAMGSVANQSVVGGRPIVVAIGLKPTDKGPTFGNHLPVVSVVANPAQVAPGEVVRVEATATDEDDDVLNYFWSSDGGTFLPNNQSAAFWTAPALSPGEMHRNFTLHVDVSDGRGPAVPSSIDVEVIRADGGPDAGVDEPPSITGIVPSKAQLAPGESVELMLTITDPLGPRDLSYDWTAECDGEFTPDAHQPSPTFTLAADYVVEQDNLTCKFTVEVATVSNLRTTGFVVVNLRPPVPPDIVSVTAEPTEIRPGDTANLDIVATDPNGGLLSYRWESDCPGTFTPDHQVQTPRFTLPANAASAGDDCLILVEVRSSAGTISSSSVTLSYLPDIVLFGFEVEDEEWASFGQGSPVVLSAVDGQLVYSNLLHQNFGGAFRSFSEPVDFSNVQSISFRAQALTGSGSMQLTLREGLGVAGESWVSRETFPLTDELRTYTLAFAQSNFQVSDQADDREFQVDSIGQLTLVFFDGQPDTEDSVEFAVADIVLNMSN